MEPFFFEYDHGPVVEENKNQWFFSPVHHVENRKAFLISSATGDVIQRGFFIPVELSVSPGDRVLAAIIDGAYFLIHKY